MLQQFLCLRIPFQDYVLKALLIIIPFQMKARIDGFWRWEMWREKNIKRIKLICISDSSHSLSLYSSSRFYIILSDLFAPYFSPFLRFIIVIFIFVIFIVVVDIVFLLVLLLLLVLSLLFLFIIVSKVWTHCASEHSFAYGSCLLASHCVRTNSALTFAVFPRSLVVSRTPFRLVSIYSCCYSIAFLSYPSFLCSIR
jgi:hypothetical protein